MNRKKIVLALFFAPSVCLVFTENAYAYLDLGTVNYYLQVLIAGALGALFTMRVYWYKTKQFFKKLFSKKNSNEDI